LLIENILIIPVSYDMPVGRNGKIEKNGEVDTLKSWQVSGINAWQDQCGPTALIKKRW
jgi:hypothetical protein